MGCCIYGLYWYVGGVDGGVDGYLTFSLSFGISIVVYSMIGGFCMVGYVGFKTLLSFGISIVVYWK